MRMCALVAAFGLVVGTSASALAADKAKDKKAQPAKKTSGDDLDLDLDPVVPQAPAKKATSSAPAAAAQKGAPAGDDLDLEMTLPPPTPPAVQERKTAPALPAQAPTPAPAPLAERKAEPAKEEPAAAAGDFARWRITPEVSFGYVDEQAVSPLSVPQFGYGLSAEVFFNKAASLQLGLKDQLYQRTYVTSRPDLASADLARADLSEHQLSAELVFGYEILHHMTGGWTRFSLTPLVGPSYRMFLNDSLRSQTAAVAVGGRFGVQLSEQLDVSVGGLWGYNLLKNDELLSALGGPKAVSTVDAGLGLKLAPGTRFRLAYQGEIVTLAASYRLYHSLGFLFDVLF